MFIAVRAIWRELYKGQHRRVHCRVHDLTESQAALAVRKYGHWREVFTCLVTMMYSTVGYLPVGKVRTVRAHWTPVPQPDVTLYSVSLKR